MEWTAEDVRPRLGGDVDGLGAGRFWKSLDPLPTEKSKVRRKERESNTKLNALVTFRKIKQQETPDKTAPVVPVRGKGGGKSGECMQLTSKGVLKRCELLCQAVRPENQEGTSDMQQRTPYPGRHGTHTTTSLSGKTNDFLASSTNRTVLERRREIAIVGIFQSAYFSKRNCAEQETNVLSSISTR